MIQLPLRPGFRRSHLDVLGRLAEPGVWIKVRTMAYDVMRGDEKIGTATCDEITPLWIDCCIDIASDRGEVNEYGRTMLAEREKIEKAIPITGDPMLCCGRCACWESADGFEGVCRLRGEELPDVDAGSMCEEFRHG